MKVLERPSGDVEQRRLNSNEGAQAEQQPQIPPIPTRNQHLAVLVVFQVKMGVKFVN